MTLFVAEFGMDDEALKRIRSIALALPDVEERLSHGAICFYVNATTPICRFHDEDFSLDGRVSIWCPAPPGVRDEVLDAGDLRFYAPTPSASGVFADWIGVYLDHADGVATDWQEIEAIIEEAYRLRATKAQASELGSSASVGGQHT